MRNLHWRYMCMDEKERRDERRVNEKPPCLANAYSVEIMVN
jgi:hypothetical protein